MAKNFIEALREYTDQAKLRQEFASDALKEDERMNKITAKSGKNVTFSNNNDSWHPMGQKFEQQFNDAIDFYKKEFKVTPRAHIGTEPGLSDRTGAYAYTDFFPNGTGQRQVSFNDLTDYWSDEQEDSLKADEQAAFHPKNSGKSVFIPVHEFGHVITDMFFPAFSKSSNQPEFFDKEGNVVSTPVFDLVRDSLKDIGIDYYKQEDKTGEALSEISGYATTDAYETISEALSDYYFNRNNAAPLSKAIVKRLKSQGQMYAINQSGGIDLDTPNYPYNFVENLRRYNAIQ